MSNTGNYSNQYPAQSAAGNQAGEVGHKAKMGSMKTMVLIGQLISLALGLILLVVHQFKTNEHLENVRANPQTTNEPPKVFYFMGLAMLGITALLFVVSAITGGRNRSKHQAA